MTRHSFFLYFPTFLLQSSSAESSKSERKKKGEREKSNRCRNASEDIPFTYEITAEVNTEPASLGGGEGEGGGDIYVNARAPVSAHNNIAVFM